MSDGIQENFQQLWGIDLVLPCKLCFYIKGIAILWKDDWINRLNKILTKLPRELIEAAGVRYLFVAENLQRECLLHDGIAYEFISKSEPKWIGLNVSLFEQHGEKEPDLQICLLKARLLEEIMHLWDYRLEESGSPYCSTGVEWLIEFDPKIGKQTQFNVPNRRIFVSDEEQNAEDWALAIVWYIFQPDELRRRSINHYKFVCRLFKRCFPCNSKFI